MNPTNTPTLDQLFAQMSLGQTHFQQTHVHPAQAPTPLPLAPVSSLQQDVGVFLQQSGALACLYRIYSFFQQTQRMHLVKNVELAGSELFKVLGPAFFQEKLQEQDETTQAHFCREIQKPITNCTIRFNLHACDLRDLIVSLKNSYFPSASTPFHVHATSILSGFTLDGPIRFQCIFATQLQSRFFATADALQIDITGQPFLIDNGCYDQWLSDTISRSITIPCPDARCDAKQYIMYLAHGYRPNQEAHVLFIREYVQEKQSLHALLHRLTKDFPDCIEATYYFVLLICSTLEKIGKQDVSKSFLESINTPDTASPCFWGSLWNLFKTSGLSFSQGAACLLTMSALLQSVPSPGRFSIDTSGGLVTFCSYIKNFEAHLCLPYDSSRCSQDFATIPRNFFLSRPFLDFCRYFGESLPQMHPREASASAPTDVPLQDFLQKSADVATGKSDTDITEILKLVPTVMFQSPHAVQGILLLAVQKVCNIPFVPNGAQTLDAFFEEWLDVLFTQQQHLACARKMLVERDGHTAYKKKIISSVLRQDQAFAMQLMRSIKNEIAIEDLITWLSVLQHPELFLATLAPDFFSLWVQGYSQLAAKNPEKASCLLQVLICDPMLERWGLHLKEQNTDRVASDLAQALTNFLKTKMQQTPLSKWPNNALYCLAACYEAIEKATLVDRVIAHSMPDFFLNVVRDLCMQTTLSKQEKTALRKACPPLFDTLQNPSHVVALLTLSFRHIPDQMSAQLRKRFIETLLQLLTTHQVSSKDIGWVYSLDAHFPSTKTAPVEEVRILTQICMQFPENIAPTHTNRIKELSACLQPAQKEALVPDLDTVEQTCPQFSVMFAGCKPAPSRATSSQTAPSDAKSIDTQVHELLRKKTKNWQTTVITLLGPQCDAKTWESAFTTCHKVQEFDTVSQLIFSFYEIRTKVSDDFARNIFTLILSNISWLRDDHTRLFKDADYFRRLFSESLQTPEMQTVCLHWTETFLKAVERSQHEYLRTAFNYWDMLAQDAPKTQTLGYRLFCIASKIESKETLEIACGLVLELHTYFRALVEDSQPHTKPRMQQKKQPPNACDTLIQFVKNAKKFSSETNAQGALMCILQILLNSSNATTDDILLTTLSDHPDIRIAEALVPIYYRINIRRMVGIQVSPTTQNAYRHLLFRLLKDGHIDIALNLYADYFLPQNQTPSRSYFFIRKRQPIATSTDLQKLYDQISEYYPKRLLHCAVQGTPQQAKRALEIAIGLCFAPSEKVLQIFNEKFPQHFDVMLFLYIRALEEFGFDDEMKSLESHLLMLAVDQKLLDRIHMTETFEATIFPASCNRFYQNFLLNTSSTDPKKVVAPKVVIPKVVIPRATVIKEGTDLLASEVAFISFVKSLTEKAIIQGSSKKLTESVRAMFLDFAVLNIRSLLELYPNTECIRALIEKLCKVAIQDSETLQRAHSVITETLKKEAKLLAKTQNLETLKAIKEKIIYLKAHPEKVTQSGIVSIQHEIFSWQENDCVDAYEEWSDCIGQLLELIKIKNLFIDFTIHEMMELLLVPHFLCFGQDSDVGKLHAYTLCRRYTEHLRQADVLHAMSFLKNAQKGKAFEGKYGEFCELVRSLIPNFIRTAKLEGSYVLFTALIGAPTKDENERIQRNTLIADWIQHPHHTPETRGIALKELVELQALRYLTDDDLQTAQYLFDLVCIQPEPFRSDIFPSFRSQLDLFTFPELPPVQVVARAKPSAVRKK